ncbi:MAG: thermonuclease family protein [Sphingomonadales bacterium]
MFALLLLALLSGAAMGGEAISGRARAITGDQISLGGAVVRLFDVMAPLPDQTCQEWRGPRQVPYPCGQYAMAFLTSLVADKTVTCVTRQTLPDDDRVASCFADGVDLGEALVRAGWAVTCGQSSRYVLQEAAARAERKGLWIGNFAEDRTCYRRGGQGDPQ